ncbi:MAG: hypothetical protein NTX29_05100 [Actinobacteria bacterium]|nr:hypothetical protein [Actinomycetota bacterium]
MDTRRSSQPRTRAEHDSLEGYLASVLTEQQRANVLLISFSQWDFTTGAVAETAVTLNEMGAGVSLALWAGCTPLKDVGWTTMPTVARVLRSPSRDQRLAQALSAAGLPDGAFADPPLARWSPAEPLSIPSLLNRTAIRTMRYRGSDLGRAILQVAPDRNTPVTDAFIWPKAWVEATTRSYAYAYDQATALMQQRGVTAVIVYNGRFLHDSAAAGAAEAMGLPVIAYDMGGNDTDFDLTIDATHDWSALQGRMKRIYDTWSVDERDELGSSWFLERTNHVDPRNSLFVESQEIGAGIERPDTDCLVVFFSSSGDEISELDLDWGDYFYGQPEALMAVADACRARPECTFVVRSHPHKRMKPAQDVADWIAAVDAAAPDIHVDHFSAVDSYALMRQADVVVTYGSTTGVEAAFAGKPVIVMRPSAYDELGCATRVLTREELGRAIDERIPGQWAGAVSYGLMMRRRGFSYRYVEMDDHGRRSLAGVDLDQPRQLVLNISHARGRLQKWALTRKKGAA